MPITLEQVQTQWANRNAVAKQMEDVPAALLAFEETLRDTVNANAMTTQEGAAFLQAFQTKMLGSVPASYPAAMITDYKKFKETCEANGYTVSRQTSNGDEVLTVSQSE